MLQYSKIYGLLTNKNPQKGAANFGLNCTVHESYSRNGLLRYVYFETPALTSCLLYINPDTFQVVNDVAKKFTEITRWEKPEISLNTIITTDQNIPLIPEIKTSSSPDSFVNLLRVFLPSTKSISYKIGVSLEEYLLIQTGDEIDVFFTRCTTPGIAGRNREPKLLIVVDLTTLLNDASTDYIERVYLAVNKVLAENCEQFWSSLNSLLMKCQKVKIVTNGRKKTPTNLLVKMAQLQSSHIAIKTALQSLDFQEA